MSGSNVTVDDNAPSIYYFGSWQMGPGCAANGCSASPPDLSQVYDTTWHDGRLLSTNPSDSLTASFNFTGTAIYVFGITINNTQQFPLVKNQNLVFTIDGAQVGTFQFTPTGPRDTYNVNFLRKTDLSPDQHTLVMSVQNNSFVLFDYLIYTSLGSSSSIASSSSSVGTNSITAVATPSSSSSGSSNTGTIVGAVVGSVGGITIVAFIIFLIRYYRQGKDANSGLNTAAVVTSKSKNKNKPAGPNTVDPFIVPPRPSVVPGNVVSTTSKSSTSIPQPPTSVDPTATSSGSRSQPSSGQPVSAVVSPAAGSGRGPSAKTSSSVSAPQLGDGMRAVHWNPPPRPREKQHPVPPQSEAQLPQPPQPDRQPSGKHPRHYGLQRV